MHAETSSTDHGVYVCGLTSRAAVQDHQRLRRDQVFGDGVADPDPVRPEEARPEEEGKTDHEGGSAGDEIGGSSEALCLECCGDEGRDTGGDGLMDGRGQPALVGWWMGGEGVGGSGGVFTNGGLYWVTSGLDSLTSR